MEKKFPDRLEAFSLAVPYYKGSQKGGEGELEMENAKQYLFLTPGSKITLTNTFK